jgi:hypothetical protein
MTESTIQYNSKTEKRARRALMCSSFKLSLFTTMRERGVSLNEIGTNADFIVKKSSENRVEKQLSWLINVGVLRREVDGQGITDSFRLTPLGKQIIEKWRERDNCLPKPSFRDAIANLFNLYSQGQF